MSVRLFVLGLVYQRDTHGYDIKETAKLWGLERWANIGFGSIYHALGKLQEEGMIEERGVEQEGNRPPRYVYRITPTGQAAFLELLRETCRHANVESRDIDLALAFIHNLPSQERVELLRLRLQPIQERLDSLEAALAQFRAAQESDAPELAEHRRLLTEAPWVYIGVQHSYGRVKFEYDWMQSVLETVADWQPKG